MPAKRASTRGAAEEAKKRIRAVSLGGKKEPMPEAVAAPGADKVPPAKLGAAPVAAVPGADEEPSMAEAPSAGEAEAPAAGEVEAPSAAGAEAPAAEAAEAPSAEAAVAPSAEVAEAPSAEAAEAPAADAAEAPAADAAEAPSATAAEAPGADEAPREAEAPGTDRPTRWLVKDAPEDYSFEQLKADGKTRWDGVRSMPARANLRKMRPGDLGLFYQSSAGEDTGIVGAIRVASEPYPDPADEQWACVDIEYHSELPGPELRLHDLKALAAKPEGAPIADMPLMHLSARISVQPVPAESFEFITDGTALRLIEEEHKAAAA